MRTLPPHMSITLLVLICLSQAGCAWLSRRSARGGTYAIQDILGRDGLLAQGDPTTQVGKRVPGQWLWAEVNGQGPRELVLRVDEYLGKQGVAVEYHVYDVRNPYKPRRVGAPARVVTTLETPHRLHARAHDVNRDGRQEIVVFGATDGHAPCDLYVFAWHKDHFQDRVWAGHPGTSYVWFDHDGNGTQELIAFWRVAPHAPVRITLLSWTQGYLRETPPRSPVEAWLPRAWDHAVRFDPMRRPEVLLPMMRHALKERGLQPYLLPQTLEILTQRLLRATSATHRAAYLHAMRWSDAPSVLLLAMEHLETTPPSPINAAAGALLAEFGEAHHQERVLEVFRARLLDPKHPLDAPFFAHTLDAFDARNSALPFDLVESMLLSASTPPQRKTQLLEHLLSAHPGFAPALLRALQNPRAPDIAIPAARALARVLASDTPQHTTWRRRVPTSTLLKHLSHQDSRVREAIARALSSVATPKDQDAILAHFWHETHPHVRTALIDALTTLPPSSTPAFPLLQQLLAAPPSLRAALHRWVAKHAPPGLRIMALASIKTAADLTPYEVHNDLTPAESDPLWPTALAALTRALQHPGDHELRLSAARIASHIPSLHPILRGRLDTEPDVSVRGALVQSLASAQDLESLPLLVAMLRTTTDQELRAHLIDALGAYTSPLSVQALQTHLRHPQADISRTARALARAGGTPIPYVTQKLTEQLQHTNPGCAKTGDLLGALFALGDPQAPERLTHIINTPACAPHASDLIIAALRTPHPQHTSWRRAMRQHPDRNVRLATQTQR